MANGNFVVQNGLTVGPLTIDAATGSISTPGTVSVTGGLAVSTISKNDSSISINDTGTNSNVSIVIDGVTEHILTQYLTTLNGNLSVSSTGYLTVPVGTNAQRPGSPSNGMMRYNSDITSFEGYYAGAWSSLGGVKSVDGKSYITAEASAGAGDDVIRVYAGDSGTSTQVAWASTSNVKVLPTTVSTSSTTGALQVAGGAGIAGSLYVGGNFVVTGNMTVNGTTTTINNTTVETTEYVQTIDATTIRAATIGNASAVLYGTLNSSSAAQTNITSVGTLTGLTVSGAIIPSSNVAVNLGSTSAWFNNIYGTAVHAMYADLAENYLGDKQYNPGTVVMFGGAQEVTIASADTTAVAGVVSTNPATLMNGALTGPNVVPVAFTGRVPCNVIGPVAKGDLMVSAGFGFAKTNNTPQIGQVIGKALQDFPINGKGVIEVVVGRF